MGAKLSQIFMEVCHQTSGHWLIKGADGGMFGIILAAFFLTFGSSTRTLWVFLGDSFLYVSILEIFV